MPVNAEDQHGAYSLPDSIAGEHQTPSAMWGPCPHMSLTVPAAQVLQPRWQVSQAVNRSFQRA